MAEVTICIPAYSSHEFIAETLNSVNAQSFRDFVVHIAVEPSADYEKTVHICQAYCADPRFTLSVNEQVLGWAGNIRAQLDRVTTPFFVVLPHDDGWHPEYLSASIKCLHEHPQAVVAFTDIAFFGSRSGTKMLDIDNTSLFTRLLSFFHGGAEGTPWRGVTRSAVLAHKAFPVNDFRSFAVECEWSLYLLLCGEAQRIKEPLYLKRSFSEGTANVSGQWRRSSDDAWLSAALEHHRASMLAGLKDAGLTGTEADCLVLACETAMLRRSATMSAERPALLECYMSKAEALDIRCKALPAAYAAPIKSRLQYVKGRGQKLAGNLKGAIETFHYAAELDPDNWEALVNLSLLLSRKGDSRAALAYAEQAVRTAPGVHEVNVAFEVCKKMV